MKDYSEEIKGLIEKYKDKGFVFSKKEKLLLERVKSTKKEIEEEIKICKNLEFTEKQERNEETRYLLFFTHDKNYGRAYVIKLNGEIKIITAFPIGKKTLRKYRKKRFK